MVVVVVVVVVLVLVLVLVLALVMVLVLVVGVVVGSWWWWGVECGAADPSSKPMRAAHARTPACGASLERGKSATSAQQEHTGEGWRAGWVAGCGV